MLFYVVLLWQLILLILFIRQLFIFSLTIYTERTTDVPYHQTITKTVALVKDFCQRHNPNTFYELGCGQALVSRKVAPFCQKVVAVDQNRILLWLGKMKTKWAGLAQKITFKQANLFEIDLSQADVVYLYLLTEVNQRLVPKLENELKKDTYVISWKFPLESQQFTLIQEDGSKDKLRIYRKV